MQLELEFEIAFCFLPLPQSLDNCYMEMAGKNPLAQFLLGVYSVAKSKDYILLHLV